MSKEVLIYYNMAMLSVMCWNVRGIMSSAYALSDILDANGIDLCIVAEHNLFTHSKSFLDSINHRYKLY